MPTLLALLAAGLTAAPMQERKPPEFPADVRMIRLDVSVVDRSGRPVAGLGREAFVVTEDGIPVDLAMFEAVEAGAGRPVPAGEAGDEPSLARPARRILLLVDSGGMTHGQLTRARASVARYLHESTSDGDRVRLVNLSTRRAWDGDIPLDRVRLEAAARSLGRRESPWAWAGESSEAAFLEDRVEQAGEGEPSQAETAGRFLSQFARATDLLGTLEGLLVELSAQPGRKALVLVSPGFPSLRDLDRRLQRVATLARDAATAVYYVDAVGLDGLEPQGGRLRPAFETAWARSGGAQDLAEATGGFTSRFANALEPALARVAGEMRTYYVVGYVPRKPQDGRFRSVRVRVRGGALEARTKKGYLAER